MTDRPPASLTDRATETLLRRLASDEWPLRGRLPGQNELARQLNVSVVVVREALARLKADGLVESRQGAGVFAIGRPGRAREFRVSTLADGDRQRLGDVFEVRRTIEVAAAQQAARRRDADDILACTEAFKQLKAALAAGDAAIALDFEFHLSIAKASHNVFYPDLLRHLHEVLTESIGAARARTLTMPGRIRLVQEEHAAILQAVVSGNATAAGREMQQHLVHAAERLELPGAASKT